MARRRFSDLARAALPFAPLALATTLLAVVASRSVLAQTGGEPAVPLDDTFIHFQYARAFARLEPLVYTHGSAATPGATSLLWPLLLSPFHALGLSGTRLVWAAWALGWLSLGLLAHETHRLALGLVRRELAIAAGAMVLSFGGLVWCAGSGMEVVPFSWLLVRTARLAADWGEHFRDGASRRERLALIAFALLASVMRPEGVLAALMAATAIAIWPRRATRAWALAALAGTGLTPLVNHLLTGQSSSTTAIVKWLPLSPYHQGERLWRAISANQELFFGTLLDGRLWSAIFVPTGARVVGWVALPALAYWAFRQRREWRGAMALVVALGILIPTTYDSFLWNRLRYLWPFTPGWFVALAALAELAGDVAERFRAGLGFVRVLLAGLFVGSFASELSHCIDDLAVSSDAIRRQQVALGRWAKDALPKDALIGVSDTGAIAYFSDRRTFDVVGLTTKGEARYWAAGAGSRFEHYERLPKRELPTHFIVYPDWMAVPPLLGEELTERTVHATILGGTSMVAYVADYTTLGSAEEPLGETHAKLVDRLDVADLESEAAHGYALFWATQAEDRVVEDVAAGRPRADGGRSGRTLERFELELRPGGTLIARLATSDTLEVRLRVDERELGTQKLEQGAGWHELSFALPAAFGQGRHRVELVPTAGKDFTALHYFSL